MLLPKPRKIFASTARARTKILRDGPRATKAASFTGSYVTSRLFPFRLNAEYYEFVL